MLILHWLLTGAALLTAAVALLKARRASKRVEQLTESYWDLRYEHGQLRALVGRLEPESPSTCGQAASPPADCAFVPLSSLKR